MITDPIADLLTRVRNAIQRKKDTVEMPNTKMVEAVISILKREGFVTDYEVLENEPQNKVVIHLKYVNGQSPFRELVRVSKPGIRKYRGYKEIKPILRGMGIAIFSTPIGIITGEEAIKAKVGGEYLCYIY